MTVEESVWGQVEDANEGQVVTSIGMIDTDSTVRYLRIS